MSAKTPQERAAGLVQVLRPVPDNMRYVLALVEKALASKDVDDLEMAEQELTRLQQWADQADFLAHSRVAAYEPPLAREFVTMLQENCAETLEVWLRAHGAPECIIDLAIYSASLDTYWDLVEGGSVAHIERMNISEQVRLAVNAIADAGGEFRGPCSTSYRRAAPDWEKAVSK